MLTLVLLLLMQEPAEEDRLSLPPPPLVTLERGERTVGETLKAIRDQTKLRITVRQIDEKRKATIGWKSAHVLRALDELCRVLGAGDLKIGKEDIELDGSMPLPKAVGHGDRFRFLVQDVQVTTTRTLEETKREVRLTLRVEGPPGTEISGAETEAILDDGMDDQGWSLTPSEGLRGRWNDIPWEDRENPDVVEFERGHGRGAREGRLNLQLEPPSREAKGIERLLGRMALTYPMKKVEGKIPVGELVEGKEFHIGPTTFAVKSFAAKELEASLSIIGRAADDEGMFSFPVFTLVDADGKLVSGSSSGTGTGEGYSYTYGIVEGAKVAALQYHATVGRTTKVVRFEIRNIPLPARK